MLPCQISLLWTALCPCPSPNPHTKQPAHSKLTLFIRISVENLGAHLHPIRESNDLHPIRESNEVARHMLALNYWQCLPRVCAENDSEALASEERLLRLVSNVSPGYRYTCMFAFPILSHTSTPSPRPNRLVNSWKMKSCWRTWNTCHCHTQDHSGNWTTWARACCFITQHQIHKEFKGNVDKLLWKWLVNI